MCVAFSWFACLCSLCGAIVVCLWFARARGVCGVLMVRSGSWCAHGVCVCVCVCVACSWCDRARAIENKIRDTRVCTTRARATPIRFFGCACFRLRIHKHIYARPPAVPVSGSFWVLFAFGWLVLELFASFVDLIAHCGVVYSGLCLVRSFWVRLNSFWVWLTGCLPLLGVWLTCFGFV